MLHNRDRVGDVFPVEFYRGRFRVYISEIGGIDSVHIVGRLELRC